MTTKLHATLLSRLRADKRNVRKTKFTQIVAVASLLVAGFFIFACSSETENTSESAIPAMGPDENDISISIVDWGQRKSFCETASGIVELNKNKGGTVEEGAKYAADYAQLIRVLSFEGPQDPGFVTTINTMKWAAETTELTFSEEPPEEVPQESYFEHYLNKTQEIQGSPGVRSAAKRLDVWLTDACGFTLEGVTPNETLNESPSFEAKPPTQIR